LVSSLPSSLLPKQFFRGWYCFANSTISSPVRVWQHFPLLLPAILTPSMPPNGAAFSFAEEIETQLVEVGDYRCYPISINGRQVLRPYCEEIILTLNSSDHVHDIEFVRFKGVQCETIAVGWYSKSSFLATLPAVLNVKGIRVRQRDIEVGGEHFLDDKYSETRFSVWQIGEIHVVNGSLKCSNTRIANSRVHASLTQLEKLFESPLTFIDEEHHRKTSDEARTTLQSIEKMSMSGISEELTERLDPLKAKITGHRHKPTLLADALDMRRLNKLQSHKLLKHVAKTILANCNTNTSTEEILQQILAGFTKRNYSDHKLSAT